MIECGKFKGATQLYFCFSMESFSAFMESGLHTATSEGIGYHSDSLSRNLETTYYSADDEAVTDDHGDELCSDFWAGTEGLVVLAVALFCGVFARLVLRRTKIPYTVLLTCLGGLMGILHDVAREVITTCIISLRNCIS